MNMNFTEGKKLDLVLCKTFLYVEIPLSECPFKARSQIFSQNIMHRISKRPGWSALQFVTFVHKYLCTSTFWKISPIHDREMWWVLVCSIARIQPPPLKKETIPVWMFWWNLHHKITCIRKVWVVRGEGGSSRGSGVHGMISPHSSYTSFMTSYVT